MIPGYRRLAGIYDDRTVPVEAPWDLSEAVSPHDWKKAGDLTRAQGYSDLSKSAVFKLDPKEAIGYALSLLFTNPKAKTTYIKDPASKLVSADDIARAVEKHLTGDGYPAYGSFGFDNNDTEIYADGPDVFRDGEWGYYVTQAIDHGQNDTLEKNPPKVKVSRIKGKTAEGWRIDVSQPRQFYIDAGLKAGDKKAAELAKKGIRPSPYPTYQNGAAHYPDTLAKKYMQAAPKASKDHKNDDEMCQHCQTSGGGHCEMCSGEMD